MADPVATVPTPAAPAAAATPAAPVTPAATVPTPVAPTAAPTLLDGVKEAVKADAPKVEIKYELKAPEKSLLPAAHAEKIVSLAKERGLSNEQAQAVYDAESAHFKEYVDTAIKAEQEKVTKWKDELVKDPSFAGDKLAEYNAGATELLNKYGDPELMKLLQDSGFAYHKSVARFLQKLHNASKPDKIAAPGAPPAKPGERDNSPEAMASRLFPSLANKK